ncbi:uncharacterized protein LOC127137997 [Lathyrus oleraceus]|uniref:uncharacterized protein LOC127137997 n=1 Tax=Pisum sativum TaxID=3888 RepID=UPI0021D25F97|nr:uncharacterized protein LOC127137997 [Pisum sativum]
MGVRLEEGVREGRLKEGGSSDSSRRYGNGLPKKKEHDANAISQEKCRRSPRNNQRHQQVASVTLVINPSLAVQIAPTYQPCFQQHTNQQNQQHQHNQKILLQTRTPPVILKELPWWYKPDHHCAFHQGASGHDIENCLALKVEVRRLMQNGILSFKDFSPNVQANSLPKHGGATMNMVEGCPGKYCVFNVNPTRKSLVEMHATLCELSYYNHDHASCHICSRNPRGFAVVKRDLQEMLDQNLIHITRDRGRYEHEKYVVSLLVIHLVGPMPYESNKVIPYKYNATMLEDGKEVLIRSFSYFVNIADVSGVTRSGRVFAVVAPKRTEDVVVGNPTQEKTSIMQSGQSSGVSRNSDQDEVLKLIKSDFNVVDQLLHTSSKVFVISLLVNSEAHREVLQKLLKQVYVDHEVTIDQFDGIMANITACNNLSFSNEEFPEQGRNHNFALHISMNSQEDALSNMLMDTGSSLNGLPKSTMSKLSYQGSLMRFSGVVVKAFDGSMKTNGESMTSLKDAQHMVENGQPSRWGQVVVLAENKNIAGLGFSPGSTRRDLKRIQEVFHSVDIIHSKDQFDAAIMEDNEEQEAPYFVMH